MDYCAVRDVIKPSHLRISHTLRYINTVARTRWRKQRGVSHPHQVLSGLAFIPLG